MRTVSFSQFLHETDNTELFDIMYRVQTIAPIPKTAAELLIHLVRTHMAVGSDPEAVATWIATQSYDHVDACIDSRIAHLVSQSAQILNLEPAECRKVWKRLVKQMARENTRFHQVRPQDEANHPAEETLLLYLVEQQLVRQVRRIDRPQQPYESYVYHSKYKYYMQDTGLFRRLTGLPATAVNAEEPTLSRFRGVLSESYALQGLVPLCEQGPWYWKSGHQAEVDFVLSLNDTIVPVEVKTARNVTSHSLARYRQLYAPEAAVRLSLLNLKRDDDLVNVPLYMTEFIPHILTLFRKMETP
jgi:hypothetical protein